jgi:hypothetical protein
MSFFAFLAGSTTKGLAVLVLEVAGLVGAQARERCRHRRRLEPDSRHVREVHQEPPLSGAQRGAAGRDSGCGRRNGVLGRCREFPSISPRRSHRGLLLDLKRGLLGLLRGALPVLRLHDFTDTTQFAGDFVLRELASLFRPRVRREECLARYGGEEFCIILPEGRRDAAAMQLSAALTNCVSCVQSTHSISTECDFRDVQRRCCGCVQRVERPRDPKAC